MKVFLCQNREEINHLRKHKLPDAEHIKVIAWTPFGVDECQSLGIPYKTIADYIPKNEVPDDLYNEFHHLRDWCEIADELVQEYFPEVKRTNSRLFINKLLELRIPYYLIFNEIKKIRYLGNSENFEKVYFFPYENHYALLSQVISMIPGHHPWFKKFKALPPPGGLKYRSFLPENSLPRSSWQKESRIRSAAKLILGRSREKRAGVSLRAWMGLKARGVNILALYNHNEQNVYRRLQSQGVNVFFLNDFAPVKARPIPEDQRVRACLDRLKNFPEKHKLLKIAGCDFSPIFEQYLSELLRNDIPVLTETVHKFRKIQKKYNFQMVLSPYDSTQSGYIFDECIRQQVPVKLLLHGGTVGLLADIPMLTIGYRGRKSHRKIDYAVYSRMIEEYCYESKKRSPLFDANIHVIRPSPMVSPDKKSFPKTPATKHNSGSQQDPPQPVGGSLNSPQSSFLSPLSKEKGLAKVGKDPLLKICYVCAGTGIFNVHLKAGIYSDEGLYQLRYKVKELVNNSQKVHFNFKFGYHSEDRGLNLEKNILEQAYPRVSGTPSGIKLTSLLDKYDLFILENPSTTLIEVLSTSKPVIMLADSRALKLTEESEKLLAPRITICRSPGEFLGIIEDLAGAGHSTSCLLSKNLEDRSFLDTFTGVHDKCEHLEEHIMKSLVPSRIPLPVTDLAKE